MDEVLYSSQPMLIGKTKWRLLIVQTKYNGVCTAYQWKQEEGGRAVWQEDKAWPTYDSHDPFDGLPRTLSKLYERETEALARFGLRAMPKTTQLGLDF